MVERWAIQMLGGLSAHQGQHQLTRFRTQKTGSLLAFLALQGGRPIARDILFEIFWPGNDLSSARNNLNVALSSLRAQLEAPAAEAGASPHGTILIADKNTIWLHPEAFTTDVGAFEEAVRQGREYNNSTGGWKAAAEAYTGALLPGFYDDWVVAERERLADLHLEALRNLAIGLIDTCQLDAALDIAHRLVHADPLGEESRRLLMRVYSDLGRAADVREQLAELERRRLDAGEPPATAETRWLVEHLTQNPDSEKRQVTPPVAAPPKPLPPPSAANPAVLSPLAEPIPGNLPLRLTRFFGRTEEVAALSDLLQGEQTQLVTITGTGGAGKTRLAIEVARQVTTQTASGGAWFVPLADQTDPGQILNTVRDALQLPRQANSDPIEQLVAHLNDHPALIVLDNLEHLLGRGPADTSAAAAVLRTLQTHLPSITWLVTSRRVLGNAGEVEFPLPLLPTPAEDTLSPAALLEYSAAQLFVDRARQRRPDFAITARNAETVARLLIRLEGIPLAIELAAAWVKLLTPTQMLDKLERRFDLLVSHRADIPERHRTLRATVEWGYELLSPESRRLFDALSVLRGTWSAEAAEAICGGDGETLERLAILRDASLIRADEGAAEMRFSLLETLRMFGDERLDADRRSELELKHAEYFLGQAEAAYKALHTPQQQAAYDRLEEDLPNLRIGLERFASTHIGLQLAGTLGHFWKIRGHYQEGLNWLQRVLAPAPTEPERTHALAWNAVGMLSEDQADYAAASDAYTRSREIFQRIGNDNGVVNTTHNLGNIAYRQGDMPRARALYAQALEGYQRREDSGGVASMLGSLANVAQAEGDLIEAERLQNECLQRARENGDTRMIAYTLHNLGNLATLRGEPEEALGFYQESLPIKEALSDRRGVASLRTSLGILALESGSHEVALVHLRDALRALRELGNKLHMVTALETLALHAYQNGEQAHAARLWSATQTAREQLSMPQSLPEQEKLSQVTAEAHSAFETDWAAGSLLSVEEAADCALLHIQTHYPSL